MRAARDRVLDAFYAAYDAGDAAAAAALYAPHGAHEEAASGKARESRAAVEVGARGFLCMLEGLRFDQIGRIHAGDQVLVHYRMRGRMTRPIGPFAPHGGEVSLTGAHLFRFAGTEILRSTDYWEGEAFLAQIRPTADQEAGPAGAGDAPQGSGPSAGPANMRGAA